MKIQADVYARMRDDIAKIIEQKKLCITSQDHGKTGLKFMWAMLTEVSQNRAYPDTHPWFANGHWKRYLDYDGRDYCFYYAGGCSDSHVATALKSIKEELLERQRIQPPRKVLKIVTADDCKFAEVDGRPHEDKQRYPYSKRHLIDPVNGTCGPQEEFRDVVKLGDFVEDPAIVRLLGVSGIQMEPGYRTDLHLTMEGHLDRTWWVWVESQRPLSVDQVRFLLNGSADIAGVSELACLDYAPGYYFPHEQTWILTKKMTKEL